MKTFTKLFLSLTAAITQVHAEDAKPDNQFTTNLAATSDYRYRGISQTRLDPAVQGGADYTNNPTGFYAGTWLSSIRWIQDAGGNSNVEWDIYAGKRGTITDDISYDVGVLRYQYLNNQLENIAGFVNANTTELYGQLNYGPAYLKYSQAITNLFGFVDSKNSGYLDAGANIPLNETLTINVHLGHQAVEHNSAASYEDWKIGVTKDFGIVAVSLADIGTNADKTAYASPINGKFMGKNALVATISRTF